MCIRDSPKPVFSHIDRIGDIRTETDGDREFDLFVTCDVSARDRLAVADEYFDRAKKTVDVYKRQAVDIPLVRFRDKGTPADNLSNYDSAAEQILYVAPVSQIKNDTLLFVTKTSMCKLVEGREFDVAKRTIASTKLAPGDELIFVGSAGEMEQVLSLIHI